MLNHNDEASIRAKTHLALITRIEPLFLIFSLHTLLPCHNILVEKRKVDENTMYAPTSPQHPLNIKFPSTLSSPQHATNSAPTSKTLPVL